MAKLETLELEIVQRTRSTSTTSLKRLSEALNALADAGNRAGSIDRTTSALEGLNRAANELSQTSTAIKRLGTALKKLFEDTGNVNDVVDGLERVAAAIAQIGAAGSALGGVSSSVRDISIAAKSGGKITIPGGDNPSPDIKPSGAPATEAATATEKTAKETEKATEKVEAFTAAVRKSNAHVGGWGRKLLAMPFKKFGRSVSNAVGSVTNLWRSLKRIAMYRGLRTLLKEITQGFGEGVKNLYAWADLVGNDFKQSMDQIATSTHYLKNSLGAMVSPIIDALAPAIDFLVDKFVELLNIVNQFLATITGKDTWRKAVKTQREYGKETDKAAGAQKRLNKQLMAFDELNNITTSQSGGRGGGNDDTGEGDFVVEAVPDWAKEIRDAIESGNWYEAGSLLGEKLNGLINDWNAGDWGQRLGQKVMDGIDLYNGFMDTTNWKNLGGKLATFLDNALGTINPKDLGHAIVQTFNAAIDILDGFAGEFDWSAAGKFVADVIVGAIENIKWKNLGEGIANLAGGILDFITAAIGELVNNADVIISAIGDFFSGLGWDGLKNVVELVGLIAVFKTIFGSAMGSGAAAAAANSANFTGVGATLSSTLQTALGVAAGLTLSIDFVVNTGKGFVTWDEFLEGFKTAPWNTPEKSGAEYSSDYVDAYEQGNWWAKLQGNNMYQAMFAMQTDPELQQVYEAALEKYADYVDETMATDKYSMARHEMLQYFLEKKALRPGGTNEDQPWWDFSEPLASVQEYQAAVEALPLTMQSAGKDAASGVGQITAATKLAKKGVRAIPPDGTDINNFKEGMTQEALAVDKVGKEATGTKKDITAIAPSKKDTKAFLDSLTPWKNGLNGKDASIARSAGKAGDALLGIIPTTKETGNFKDSLSPWKAALNGKDASIARSAGKAEDAVLDVTPTAKETKAFGGAMDTWKEDIEPVANTATDADTALKEAAKKKTIKIEDKDENLATAAGNSKIVYENLDGLAKSYAIALSVTGLDTAAEKAQALRDALAASGKTWKINITSDLRLKSSNGSYFTVEPMAEGGFPQQGDFFVANEAGPELVGTVNGRTAVASNQEITGIADAVYDTGANEAALLREQNQLLRQILAKNTTVNLTPNVAAGRWVNQAQAAYTRATGG